MKAYSVSVKFDMPGAGVITVAAESSEIAQQKIKTQLINYRNVEIVDTVELADVSALMNDIMDLPEPSKSGSVN